jgi:hypothetical protein
MSSKDRHHGSDDIARPKPPGFASVPQEPDPAAIDPEMERQRGERATVIYRRRIERRRQWTLFFVLLCTTMFIGALNAYKIRLTQFDDWHLDVRTRSALQSDVAYLAEFQWSDHEASGRIRPEFYLDGQPLPVEFTIRSRDEDGRNHPLGIRIPGQTAGGIYEGELVFTPVSGAANLAAERLPISLQVPAYWQEWSLLVYWLAVVLLMLVGLAAFNTYWYPAPRGQLECHYYVGGRANLTTDRIELRTAWSWLPVPRRCIVDLTRKFNKRPWAVNFGAIPRMTVEYERLAVGYGVVTALDLGSAPDAVRVSSTKPQVGGDERMSPAPIRAQVRRSPATWYVIRAGEDWIAFRFVP